MPSRTGLRNRGKDPEQAGASFAQCRVGLENAAVERRHRELASAGDHGCIGKFRFRQAGQ